jgi:restriction system protein
VDPVPGILLQSVVVPAGQATEGQLIEAVTLPWYEIIRLIQQDDDAIYQIDWRKWEEIIAGAYTREGYTVTLTPRSGDDGRDVIAEKDGVGCIRIVDQVKRYAPGHLVSADDVRSMLGVLEADQNVSKGIVTTTSDFEPGVYTNPKLTAFMPYRLELKPKQALIDWLAELASRTADA